MRPGVNLASVVALLVTLFAAPTWAVNRCTGPDGAVVFQDAPCAGKGEALNVRPASGHANAASLQAAERSKREVAGIEHSSKVNQAITRGEPLVGMTRAELDQAMGAPTKVNADNYQGRRKDQIIYERRGQTWYVYTDDGMVTSIQNRPESSLAAAGPGVNCPTPLEIRAMETSASSIRLSEAERVERLKQIGEARKCGR